MKKGFTLIEVMVSLGLFTVVAVMALTALLTVEAASRRSEATRALVDEIGSAMEDMSRTIQSGSGYAGCSPGHCSSLSVIDSAGDTVVYSLNNASGTGVVDKSVQPEGQSGGAMPVALSPSAVNVTNLDFQVTNYGNVAGLQPRVQIILDAVIDQGTPYQQTISLQTTVTERPTS